MPTVMIVEEEDEACCQDTRREECRCSSFCVDHPNPFLFTVSQWPASGVLYVLYRVAVAIYFLVWLVMAGMGDRTSPLRLAELSQWSMIILVISLIWQAFIAGFSYWNYQVNKRPKPTTMGWGLKMEWILYNVSAAAAFAVSITYWALLYLPNPDAYTLDLVSIHLHAVNSGMVLLDLFIAGIPLRLAHIYQPFLYIVLYFTFNILYIFAGGVNQSGDAFIYPNMDWLKDPAGGATTVGISLAGIIGVWLALWMLKWLSRAFVKCCCYPEEEEEEEPKPCHTSNAHSQVKPYKVHGHDNMMMVHM